MQQSDLKNYLDDLFDNLQCYYPITFEIMEEEKGSVVKSQLIQSLDRCLTSSPLFLKDTISMIFENVQGKDEYCKISGLKTLGILFQVDLPLISSN